MISLLGYNFFGDGNALDPTPTSVDSLSNAHITGGIVDQVDISKATNDDTTTQSDEWDENTIIKALFDGNLLAGNVDYATSTITSIRVKRRRIGTFEWTTLYEKDVSSVGDLSFIINDNLAEYNVEYEYAFVPLAQGVEGSYSIQSIVSKFNGVFISDDSNIFRLDANVSYGTNSAVTKHGVYEPYGRKYPVIVSNGVNNYETGSFSGLVLPNNYDPSNPIPRNEIVDQRRLFIDFLNNRKPKVLKDWNGNIQIISIVDNPTTTYLNGSGMGLVNVTASWAEVGDYRSKQDLYESGLIPTTE